ncbi:MAG: ATP-binding SpoIIE family protein phosphatase [Candidatus Latescibacterota bacterium]
MNPYKKAEDGVRIVHSILSYPYAVLPVTEASQAGKARRRAVALAGRLGFDETETGKVAVVVTEVATNLAKHAARGEVLLGPVERDGVAGIEVLALDRGPGMARLGECMRDGYSSAGSPGTGLGAISRLSAVFDIHSVPEAGTALLARLWAGPLPKRFGAPGLDIGTVCLPMPGEEGSGDAWAMAQFRGRTLIMVVDGLGHGPGAAEASLEAVRIFEKNARLSPAEVIEAAHTGLHSTRDAAMAVAELDEDRDGIRFAGAGNIAGRVLSSGESHNMVSHPGIVGYKIHRIQELAYSWPPGALLVMHSDGLTSRWSFDRYPGLAAKHPGLIAGTLYRDYNRGNDDVTVLAARKTAASPERDRPDLAREPG